MCGRGIPPVRPAGAATCRLAEDPAHGQDPPRRPRPASGAAAARLGAATPAPGRPRPSHRVAGGRTAGAGTTGGRTPGRGRRRTPRRQGRRRRRSRRAPRGRRRRGAERDPAPRLVERAEAHRRRLLAGPRHGRGRGRHLLRPAGAVPRHRHPDLDLRPVHRPGQPARPDERPAGADPRRRPRHHPRAGHGADRQQRQGAGLRRHRGAAHLAVERQRRHEVAVRRAQRRLPRARAARLRAADPDLVRLHRWAPSPS